MRIVKEKLEEGKDQTTKKTIDPTHRSGQGGNQSKSRKKANKLEEAGDAPAKKERKKCKATINSQSYRKSYFAVYRFVEWPPTPGISS